MGARRALAGTREGYRPCPTCRHMALRHLNRGTGACTAFVTTYETDGAERTVSRTARCPCPGPNQPKEK